jgi:hypothetical protein
MSSGGPFSSIGGIQIHQQAQHQQQQRVGQLLHLVMLVLSVEIKHRENIMEFIVAKDVKVFLNVLYVKI